MFNVRMFFNFFLKPMFACSNVRRTWTNIRTLNTNVHCSVTPGSDEKFRPKDKQINEIIIKCNFCHQIWAYSMRCWCYKLDSIKKLLIPSSNCNRMKLHEIGIARCKWSIGKLKIRWTCFVKTTNSKYGFIFRTRLYRLENCYYYT